MVFPKIEAVTFDAGGTLIEPWPSVGGVYAEVAREFGVECSAERLTAQFVAAWNGRTGFRYSRAEWAEVVERSFQGITEVTPALFDAIYSRFAQARSWLIYDDVIPTLRRLESLDVRLGVISNWDDRLEPLLKDLGLATYFDEIVISSRVEAHKPDPAIFRHAAGRLGVTPGAMLHVGDSLGEDVQGARAAGLASARIRRSGAEAESDIPALIELPELLENPIKLRSFK